LETDAYGTALRYSGAGKAGGSQKAGAPDYRRFTGIERKVLREFLSYTAGVARSFYIGIESYLTKEDNGTPTDAVRDPGERLLTLALAAGVLKNSAGSPLKEAAGNFSCALRLTDKGASVEVAFVLVNEEGDELNEKFSVINPQFALQNDALYRIDDLGIHWKTSDVFYTVVKKADLTSYLSLIFSRFSNLKILYIETHGSGETAWQTSWQTKAVRPIAAQPALLFMEIDKYEYLHVRPISYLRDFPPGFLENEEIVTAVKMNEADKMFTVSEIIFPESSAELFEAALAKAVRSGGGKAAGKSGVKAAGKTALKQQVYEEDGRFIIAPEFAKTFFSENIFDLSAQFVLLETKVLAGYKLSFSKPRLKLSLSSGIDFLSGSADVEFDGQAFSFSDFMNEYRKNSCVTLADGTRSFPDKRTMDKLGRLLSTIKGGNTDGEVELSFFDIPLLLADDSIEVDGQAWEKARPFFENYNTIENRAGEWPLENGALRPYQGYGVRWLDYLCENGMGACLADEMGLGKTIQVIALLRACAARGDKGPCLILCPKSVVYNWAAELDRFAPSLSYIVHYGAERDIEEVSAANDTIKIVLSTYATLRRDIEQFLTVEFFYVILDESQNIKNLTSQTTSAVLSLKAKHRLAMSGTPIENNLQDLYSLFRFLNPSFFGSPHNFTAKYLRPIQEDEDEDALAGLKARIYPFILRRLKRDVLKDLPAKTEETAYIDLDDAQLSIYNRRRLEYKNMIHGIITKGELAKSSLFIFKALSELRRLASVPEAEGEYAGPSAKRNYLVEQITNLAENGHKCLVFANFLAGVEMVSGDLAERGIVNLTMTGATGNRQALVRSFQSDPDIKAFIMTLKTGGTGINLTAADYIFIMDPWWNSAAESQAIDRSHRIGQTNPVFCYRLIARNTIEERILELQKQKSALAGALLSDDIGALKSLSADDIAFLVEGGDE
jgi:superfamily II DNA or RNA helicase